MGPRAHLAGMETSIKMKPLIVTAAAMLFGASVMVSASATAQDLSDEWQFRAFIYMWGAQIKGGATFPGGNTADFDLKFHDVFDHLKMASVGSIEAQKGVIGLISYQKVWEAAACVSAQTILRRPAARFHWPGTSEQVV
jgi:hypothetical protein